MRDPILNNWWGDNDNDVPPRIIDQDAFFHASLHHRIEELEDLFHQLYDKVEIFSEMITNYARFMQQTHLLMGAVIQNREPSVIADLLRGYDTVNTLPDDDAVSVTSSEYDED